MLGVNETLTAGQLIRNSLPLALRTLLPGSLLAALAFLPLAGLALLAHPGQSSQERSEFLFSSLVLCRFLTPLAACLIITYVARQQDLLPRNTNLAKMAAKSFLPSVGLMLGSALFVAALSVFFVIPGLMFALATSVALPVMVIEGRNVPQALLRSWELTRDERGALFAFWSIVALVASGLLYLVSWVGTQGQPTSLMAVSIAESAVALPLIVTSCIVYSFIVSSSFACYRSLAGNATQT